MYLFPFSINLTILYYREGHSTIVTEVLQQTKAKPAAIVLSVGGGGLLCGVLKGLHKHGNDLEKNCFSSVFHQAYPFFLFLPFLFVRLPY